MVSTLCFGLRLLEAFYLPGELSGLHRTTERGLFGILGVCLGVPNLRVGTRPRGVRIQFCYAPKPDEMT